MNQPPLTPQVIRVANAIRDAWVSTQGDWLATAQAAIDAHNPAEEKRALAATKSPRTRKIVQRDA